MDQFERAFFDSISPACLSSPSFGADNNKSRPRNHRKCSASSNSDYYLDSPNTNGEVDESVRRQRRKEQNRAAQRAYRERKVNHTMDLEGRINYLEAHIEQLKAENKQLEKNISQTKVANVILRDNLHTERHASEARRPAHTASPPEQVIATDPQWSQPVLLKDLLMLYGPHADEGYS